MGLRNGVWGGAPTHCVHDSIRPAGLVRHESDQFGWWAAVLAGSLREPSQPTEPNKFGDSRRTKPAGLIESCTQGVGAPPAGSGAESQRG